MRVHLGNAELVQELILYFEDQPDCIVRRVGETEVEVSLLGSYGRDGHELALERRLSAFWAQANGSSFRLDPPASNGNGNGHRKGHGNGNGNGATH